MSYIYGGRKKVPHFPQGVAMAGNVSTPWRIAKAGKKSHQEGPTDGRMLRFDCGPGWGLFLAGPVLLAGCSPWLFSLAGLDYDITIAL